MPTWMEVEGAMDKRSWWIWRHDGLNSATELRDGVFKRKVVLEQFDRKYHGLCKSTCFLAAWIVQFNGLCCSRWILQGLDVWFLPQQQTRNLTLGKKNASVLRFLGVNLETFRYFGERLKKKLIKCLNWSVVHWSSVLLNGLFEVIPLLLDPALMLIIEPYMN